MITFSINAANRFVGMTSHSYAPPPPVLGPPFGLHLEANTIGGSISISRMISANVMFDGQPAVQLGHDVGFMTPHISVAPPWPFNVLLAVIIPFSSAKVTFCRSNVLINGIPAGAHHGSMPLLLCGQPVYLPVGSIIDASLNTVVFTATLTDVLAGWGRTVEEAALSYVAGKLAGKALNLVVGRFSRLGQWLGKKAIVTATGRPQSPGVFWYLGLSEKRWTAFGWASNLEYKSMVLDVMKRSLEKLVVKPGFKQALPYLEKIPMVGRPMAPFMPSPPQGDKP